MTAPPRRLPAALAVEEEGEVVVVAVGAFPPVVRVAPRPRHSSAARMALRSSSLACLLAGCRR